MLFLYLTLFTPLFGILLLAFISNLWLAGWVNLLISFVSALSAGGLVMFVFEHGGFHTSWFIVDPFNVYLLALTAFVSFTTGIFSRPYMAYVQKSGRIRGGGIRFYHAMYQGFMFTMLLALSTNNLGVLWIAIEGATLTTVLLVSLYRTPESIEAAWKYFIICGVGIALALFGTVLIYSAANLIIGKPEEGLIWTSIFHHAGQLNPYVLMIAFVFIMMGYGTKVGLFPMHHWLPDAHSEGPTPVSAVLSGLLLNVALYAIVRLKMVVDGALINTHYAHTAGYLMMGFGIISFLIAGLFLHRQKDIKRLFSYSSIEHMGLMTFAFGMGGALATFGALLHMLVHSLTKSAIFTTVGHATHIAETQSMDHIRGIIRTQPLVGWSLLLAVVAISGFPPFGVFTSEFLVLTATMKNWPLFAIPLLIGLVVAFAGLFRHLQPMVYGRQPEGQQPVEANMLPILTHLAIVLWLGLAIPDFFSQWLDQATALITGAHLL
jgi:hydrogenase-4 component F